MNSWLRWLLFPLVFLGTITLADHVVSHGRPLDLVTLLLSDTLFVLVFAMERALPHREEWKGSDGQRWNDFGHAIVGFGLGTWIGNALAYFAFQPLRQAVVQHFGPERLGDLLPGILLPFTVVFLLADLLRYAQHRLMHRMPILWRFHELHHTVESLGVFKSARFHIGERVIQQLFFLFPVVLLGVDGRVYALLVIANAFIGLFNHSNFDYEVGVFEGWIVGPRGHRIHHSIDREDGDANFGNTLSIWDRVFRTYRMKSRGDIRSLRMGVANGRVKSGFLHQLFAPFTSPE